MLGNGNAFQTRGGHTEDRGCGGFTATPRRAKTLAPTGKRKQDKNGNRICYGLGEFHFIQTKSLINKAIKLEFSVDGGYFVKISPCKMCITDARGWSSHTEATCELEQEMEPQSSSRR